ncbi:single-strand DNA endonuclease ASTE1 [Aplochiton taeniatus]
MGVQGLNSFVEANSTFLLKNTRFRNSKLIIDGCNLYYLLYFEHLDQVHGGEYDDLESLLTKFVSALRDSGIEPYVVLDGGSVDSDKKLATVKKRKQDKIWQSYNLSQGLKGRTLPLLTSNVVKQVLSSLKVPLAHCYGEADLEIAALARDWMCPVLSNDSDFYIFENPAGFLPISHFKWRSWRSGFIQCKRFSTATFCSHFDLQPQLLPLFAALAGNDYVKLVELGVEPNWAQFAEGGRRFGRLEGLLSWLRGFNRMEDAMQALLVLLADCGSQKLTKVQKGLGLGMEDYQPPASSLKVFFTEGTAPSIPPELKNVVPAWARLPLAQGRIPSICLDILLHRRICLRTQVQDMSLASSNATSQTIRQVMYGLLQHTTRGRRREQSAGAQGSRGPVKEYDRTGMDLTIRTVSPVIQGAAKQLHFESLDQAPLFTRLTVYLETLGVSQTVLSGIAPHLQVPVCVTCFWLRRAQPPPSWPLLQALVLGLVYGEQRRCQGVPLGGGQQVGAGGARPVLQRLWQWRQRGKQALDLEVAHSCSQWQSCFKDGLLLNQVLTCPLVEPVCAWVFRGTLVHQLAAMLRQGVTAESLLKGDPSSELLYSTLLAAVLSSQPKNKPSVLAWSGEEPPAALVKLTASLERLVTEEEESRSRSEKKPNGLMDDLPDCHGLSIRTRYKTKSRRCQSHHPELFRKRERIGWD